MGALDTFPGLNSPAPASGPVPAPVKIPSSPAPAPVNMPSAPAPDAEPDTSMPTWQLALIIVMAIIMLITCGYFLYKNGFHQQLF